MSGCGAQYTRTRRNAVLWNTAAQTVSEVAIDSSYQSTASFLEAVPIMTARLGRAKTGLTEQGLSMHEGASIAEALHGSLSQSLLVYLIQKKKHCALMRTLNEHKAANLRGSGGPGASGFLQYPSEPSCPIEDCLWSVTLRQRLGLSRAEASAEEMATIGGECHCRPIGGECCGAPLDGNGYHALNEQRGGGVFTRHNRLKRTIGGLIKRWRHTDPLYEQRVLAWDRRVRTSQGEAIEHAVLDIQYADQDGDYWIDVSVRHPAAGNTTNLRNAAKRDGEASRRGEREKHTRYPGQRLIPFVMETPGRIGAEARFWLLSQIRELPDDIQAYELQRAYRVINCAVQGEAAKQLRKAAGLK